MGTTHHLIEYGTWMATLDRDGYDHLLDGYNHRIDEAQ
jgi:hypothetical protein